MLMKLQKQVNMEDITKTGPIGLDGLEYLGNEITSIPEFDIPESAYFDFDPQKGQWLRTLQKSQESYEFNTGQDLGTSRWDKDVYHLHELDNIEDTRAQEQSAISKWANSGVKMLGTFGTTFIDGTLGTLVGLSTGIVNMFDDDDTTTFISGMWDNAVTKTTQQISNALEENFKNYRTEFEQTAAWYDKLGTANFWSEGVLKNMGFMMGTAASMVAWGGLGNIVGIAGALDKLGKIGKAAGWLGRTALSAAGESAVEAKNSMDASSRNIDYASAALYEEHYTALDNAYNELEVWRDQALLTNNSTDQSTNQKTLNEALIDTEYNRRLKELNLQKEALDTSKGAFEAEKKKALIEASNKIYLANLAFLAITNNINMGSLVRGGYKNSSDLLKHIIREVEGKAVTNVDDFAKGIMKGTASYASEAIDNVTGKTIGRGLLNMAAEGFQEGGQKVASTSNEMQLQAKLNRFINSQTYTDIKGDVKPLFTHTLNPTVNEELVDYYKALNETFKQEFGTLASPGWEEVFIGAISSGIGTPTVQRQTSIEDGKIKKGPYKLSWTGNAFWEAHQDVVGDKKVIDEYVSQLNNYIQDPKTQEKIKAAVTSASINDAQNKALLNGDIALYKNLELAQVVQSAIFFKNAGLMDDYMALYDNYAEGLTEEDLKELYSLTYSPVTGDSHLTEQQREDIKRNIQDKAKSTKQKIEQTIDRLEWNSNNYGDRFSENYRDRAITELTYLDALSWDIARRIDEIQKEIDSIANDTSAGANQKRNILLQDINKLTQSKNAIDHRYRDFIKNPKKLEGQLQHWQDEYDKYQIGKDAAATLERYNQAKTIKDIWDVYRHTNEESRDKVFEEARKKASPEIASLMKQFKDFSSDIEAIENIIEEANKDLPDSIKEIVNNNEKRWIRSLAEEIINDDTPVLTRQNLQDKIQKSIDDLNIRIDSIYNQNEDGVYTIPKDRESEYYFLLQQKSSFEDYLHKLKDLDKVRNAGENTTSNPDNDASDGAPQDSSLENSSSEEPKSNTTGSDTNKEVKTLSVNGIDIKYTEDYDNYPNDGNELIKIKNNISAYKQTEEIEFLKGIIQGIKKGIVLPPKVAKTFADIIEDNWEDLKEWYNSEYPKTEEQPPVIQDVQPTTQKRPDKEEEKSKSKGSFKGHVFEKYRFSELATNKRLVLNPGTKELNGRYKIQEFIDNYLHKVPKDAKIRYIYNEDFPNTILLGISTSYLSNILDRNKMTVVPCSVKSSDKTEEFVIIGTLGYESKDTEIAAQWSIIKSKLLQEREESSTDPAMHFVSSFYNEVKDISGGQLVTRLLEQTEEKHSYLEDLLNRDYSNPHGLTINDIKFAVVEGTEEDPKYVYVRVNSNDILYETKGRPGQVIMYVPDAKGAYVPTIIDPIFWKNLKRAHNWSAYLRDLVSNLYNTINSDNKDAAKKAIAELRDALIFGAGNNIFYNEDNNTLKYQVNGQETFTIDTKDLNSFYQALNVLNPRINIATSVLRSNPGIYSDVITTNLAILGTVGAQFYLHPVDSEGNMVKTQPAQTTPKPNIQRNSLSILYYNDSQYKTDGTNVYDYKGNPLLDSKLEQELLTILGIQNDKYPKVIVNSTTYYETPTGVYMPKQQGYRKLTDQEASKYREKKNKQKAKEEIPQIVEEVTSTNLEANVHKPEDLFQVSWTTQGSHNLFEVNDWNKVIPDVRSVPLGWGIYNNLTYFSRDTGGRADVSSIWFNTFLNESQKGKIEELFNNTIRIDDSFVKEIMRILNNPETNSSTEYKENYNGEDANQLKSQKDLENAKKSYIFVSVRDRVSRNRIIEALEKKGVTGSLRTANDIDAALKSLNIATDNIDNIDTLIDIINNCR